MSGLHATESRFQAFVLEGEGSIDSQITGDAEFRRVRLGIYYDAYRLRLKEILGRDYGALSLHAGAETFGRIAGEYVESHPSPFRNARWFGGELADFLAGHAEYSRRPELPELARLEWTLGLAFDAPDDEALRFEELAAVAPDAWPALRFEPHPCLHALWLHSNAVALWHAAREGGPAVAVQIGEAPVRYAVWRRDYASYFRSLAGDEAWALDAMRSGLTFAELCGGICEWVPEQEAALRIAGYLRNWVDEGWIRAPRLDA